MKLATNPVMVAALALALWLEATTARAEPSDRADTDDVRGAHAALSAGWLVAVTGPLGQGFAADLEFFPGGPLGRYGAGIYYRSDFSGDRGMVSGGVAFEAGATRPKLVMSLHGDLGITYGPTRVAFGGGVRSQLVVLGPLALSGNATGHFIVDGSESRLALAIVLGVGVSR